MQNNDINIDDINFDNINNEELVELLNIFEGMKDGLDSFEEGETND